MRNPARLSRSRAEADATAHHFQRILHERKFRRDVIIQAEDISLGQGLGQMRYSGQ